VETAFYHKVIKELVTCYLTNHILVLVSPRPYKPWIGNCLLKLQTTELLWTLAKCEITSEILSFEPVCLFSWVWLLGWKGHRLVLQSYQIFPSYLLSTKTS